MRPNEAWWVDRAQRGDEEAYAALVDRYKMVVWAMVRQRIRDRATAEDVAQEAFVTAYLKLDTLRDREAFCGFVLGIARNLSMKAVRAAFRPDRPGVALPVEDLWGSEALLPAGEASADSPLAAAGARDLSDAVASALGELDDPARTALILRFLEGQSYAQIAENLGLKLGTVSSLIHRALERLKPKLAHLTTEIG